MLDYKLEICIPFEHADQASIARKSLEPDPQLKQDELHVTYLVKDDNLIVIYEGISDRVLRVAVSNTLDNIKTIIECIEEFDGKQGVIIN